MGASNILRFLGLVAVLAVLGGVSAARDAAAEEPDFAERMPLADESLVLDAVPSSSGAVAVGARGHVLLTEDFESWRQAERVPTRATLTGVDFVGRRGWAAGHGAVILHSADGGETWERQHHAPEREQPFLDIMFLDDQRGFAIGAYGLFMRTTDGGETWREDRVDEMDDWHLNAIVRAESGALYIAAEQGIIYRSGDEGRSWSSNELPYQGSMFDIIALPDGEVLTFGLRGRAFRTSDDGETWQDVEMGTRSSLHGGRVLRGGRVVLVGNNGVVLDREPGASRFTRSQHSSDESLAGVLQAPSGKLIFYGVDGIGDAGAGEDIR